MTPYDQNLNPQDMADNDAAGSARTHKPRWGPEDLDRLERAITSGARVHLVRRGTDFSVRPRSLRSEGATEVLTATHTLTGEDLEFRLDEVEEWDVQ